MEITVSKNEIIKHVDRNYYLEEKEGQIKLCCFYSDYSKGSKDNDFVKYSFLF